MKIDVLLHEIFFCNADIHRLKPHQFKRKVSQSDFYYCFFPFIKNLCDNFMHFIFIHAEKHKNMQTNRSYVFKKTSFYVFSFF